MKKLILGVSAFAMLAVGILASGNASAQGFYRDWTAFYHRPAYELVGIVPPSGVSVSPIPGFTNIQFTSGTWDPSNCNGWAAEYQGFAWTPGEVSDPQHLAPVFHEGPDYPGYYCYGLFSNRATQ
jgi:hypothetical protein